ncbi:TetR family transcriptional regulator [Trinickia acidisoli]|uniref:TetR family transcriptional regulator n=1 Tax=Trinickia acidisoli TaxID=2767482 RepID=UPI001A8C3080|nr:TetR family transcriptional regulator [Trinickia acidisoli]
MVRRTKEEALQTRHRILDAAEQVFYDKGVSRTSLADIAAQAGVTRGAIYWHFANKGDLFTAMFDRVLLPLDELSARPADAADDDPLARLALVLKWCLQAASTDPRRRRVFDILFLKCEFVDEMGPVKERHQTSMREGVGKIETDLILAVEKGQLPAELDTRRGALYLHAFVGGCLRDTLLLPASVDFASHCDAFVDACIDALRTSRALRKEPPPAHH